MDNVTRPNLIWVFGDQHRAQALGYRGDPNVHTPNIDRLASEGVSFDQAVGGCPLCCPNRGSLVSGRYPHEAVPGHQVQLSPDLPTVATVFREAGYDTAYFGKWHLDGFDEGDGRAAMHVIPPGRRGGFGSWCAYENNNSQYDCWVHGGEGDAAFRERLSGYETDVLTDRFVADLNARLAPPGPSKPFFSVLSVQPPHDPYVAPEEWMRRHTPGRVILRPNVPSISRVVERARRGLAGYYAMIENLDWNIGRILTALEQAGARENTHILFFSDHGDMHGSHGQFLKTSPWEEAIRVPCIIAGGVPYYGTNRGSVDYPMNHVDLAPTSLGLCGLPVPAWMAGTDYSATRILDKAAGSYPDSAYLQLVQPTYHADSTDRPWRGIVTRDGWKYVVLEGQPWMLFNLAGDPYEQANLAHNSRYWTERRKLHARLQDWIETTDDSFPMPAL